MESPTQAQVIEKATALIARAVEKHPQFESRAPKAIELLETALRQGPTTTDREVIYWIRSSATYTDSLTHTITTEPRPPYYEVRLAYGNSRTDHHTCNCADWRHAWDAVIGRIPARPSAPPFINDNVICKHILAAISLEHARNLLSLPTEIEQAFIYTKKASRNYNDQRAYLKWAETHRDRLDIRELDMRQALLQDAYDELNEGLKHAEKLLKQHGRPITDLEKMVTIHKDEDIKPKAPPAPLMPHLEWPEPTRSAVLAQEIPY